MSHPCNTRLYQTLLLFIDKWFTIDIWISKQYILWLNYQRHSWLLKFTRKDKSIKYVSGRDSLHRENTLWFFFNFRNSRKTLNERLHEAVIYGNAKEARAALSNGCDVNALDGKGRTPLSVVVQKQQLSLAVMLIQHQADANIVDNEDRSVLHVAVDQNQDSMAKLLLDSGGNVNAADKKGQTPLMVAAEKGFPKVSNVLMNHNDANINLKQLDGKTALHLAAWNDRRQVGEMLLQRGGKLDDTDMKGWIPLMYAAKMGHTSMLHILIDDHNIDLKNKNGYTALHIAALNDRPAVVEKLLAFRSQVNATDYEGKTPLMMAVDRGFSKVFQVLIKNHHIDINLKQPDGKTALHLAACHDQTQVSKMLQRRGGKLNDADIKGWIPLMYAAKMGHTNVLPTLINDNNIHSKDKFGYTALHIAALNDRSAVVKMLLTVGSQVNAIDNNGLTPLMIAAGKGFSKVLEEFINHHDADINSKHSDGKTLSNSTAWNGQYQGAPKLIHRGCELDIDLKDNVGRTALYITAWNDQPQIAQMLIEFGSDVNSTNTNGWTPLMAAAEKGHIRVLQLLINNKAEINLEKQDGWTALHIAVLHNRTQVVQTLLANGSSVNLSDKKGWTPLIIAAEKGYTDILQVLIKHKADINVPNQNGWTALHMSAANDQVEVVKMLLNSGSEVNVADSGGQTPLMFAVQEGNNEISRILMDHKACVGMKDKYGRTALHLAAAFDQHRIAKMLISEDGNVNIVNITDGKGWTPLMFAAHEGNAVVLQVLVDHEADINLMEHNNRTALHLAKFNDQHLVVEILIGSKSKVNDTDDQGWTRVMMVIAKEHIGWCIRNTGCAEVAQHNWIKH